MAETGWIAVADQEPPDDIEVETKIDDDRGVRNEQTLVRHGRLWFVDLRLSMYVYYVPNFWRPVQEEKS